MTKREFIVLLALWSWFPLMAYLEPNTFIGYIGVVFSLLLPIMVTLGLLEPKIKKWLKNEK